MMLSHNLIQQLKYFIFLQQTKKFDVNVCTEKRAFKLVASKYGNREITEEKATTTVKWHFFLTAIYRHALHSFSFYNSNFCALYDCLWLETTQNLFFSHFFREWEKRYLNMALKLKVKRATKLNKINVVLTIERKEHSKALQISYKL